jgi:hypothetical protein
MPSTTPTLSCLAPMSTRLRIMSYSVDTMKQKTSMWFAFLCGSPGIHIPVYVGATDGLSGRVHDHTSHQTVISEFIQKKISPLMTSENQSLRLVIRFAVTKPGDCWDLEDLLLARFVCLLAVEGSRPACCERTRSRLAGIQGHREGMLIDGIVHLMYLFM